MKENIPMLPSLTFLKLRRLEQLAYASVRFEDNPREVIMVQAFRDLADFLEEHPYCTLMAVNIDTDFVEFIFDGVEDSDLA
jgi:hypothetical protein